MAWCVSYLWVPVSRREAGWVLEWCLGSPGRRREERGGRQQHRGARAGAPGWESPFIINHRRSWALQLLAAWGAGGHFTTGRGKLLWLFLFTRCQIFPSLFKKTFLVFQILWLLLFFFLIGEFIAQWNNASADWALLYLFLKSRGIAFMPPPQLCQTQLLNSFSGWELYPAPGLPSEESCRSKASCGDTPYDADACLCWEHSLGLQRKRVVVSCCKDNIF